MQTTRDDYDSRRDEDRRWLKMQEEVMNIITTQRTNQQALATMEIEIGKLSEHVEEVDDHLRGVTGESLDARIVILERLVRDAHTNELRAHGNLLRQISSQFTALDRSVITQIGDLKAELGKLQFQKSMEEESDKSKTERFKEWMKLWGSTIIAVISFATAATTVVLENWDKISTSFHSQKGATFSDQWVDAIRRQREDPKEKKRLRQKYGKDVD
jgi:hypothetical protein